MMVFEDLQVKWIDGALKTIYSGKLTDEQVVKTLRTIGQIFEQRAQNIELNMMAKKDLMEHEHDHN